MAQTYHEMINTNFFSLHEMSTELKVSYIFQRVHRAIKASNSSNASSTSSDATATGTGKKCSLGLVQSTLGSCPFSRLPFSPVKMFGVSFTLNVSHLPSRWTKRGRGVTNPGLDLDPDLDFHPFLTFCDSISESESTAHRSRSTVGSESKGGTECKFHLYTGKRLQKSTFLHPIGSEWSYLLQMLANFWWI